MTTRLRRLYLFAILGLSACSILRASVDRDRIEDSDFTETVTISYNGTTATVTHGDEVTVTYGTNTSEVSIIANEPGIEFVLTGTASDGYLQISGENRCKVTLSGLDLTSSNGPAIYVSSEERCFLELTEGTENSLEDAALYTREGSGTLHTAGTLVLSGQGSLSVTGNSGHALYSGSDIRVLSGSIEVAGAAKDAIHPKDDFQIDGGHLDLTASGDGIDSDVITIKGGRIDIKCPDDDSKGISGNDAIEISGGIITMEIGGDQSKAFSCDGAFAMTGGSVMLTLNGDVVLEAISEDSVSYTDPSYSAALKCDSTVNISGGDFIVTHNGLAGKGITADGDIQITGGTVDIVLNGSVSDTFTDSDGNSDTASGDAIKSDTNISISDAASISLRLAGEAVDGIAASGTLDIAGGSLSIKGIGDRTKALKSKGNMILAGGTIDIDMSGTVVLIDLGDDLSDPSYCTGINCDGDLYLSGAVVNIDHTGLAGKGVSIDGNFIMTSGEMEILASGAVYEVVYYDEDGDADIPTTDAFKVDGNFTATGGTLNTTATGLCGDAITVGGTTTWGTLNNDVTPIISATTSGGAAQLGNDILYPKAFKSVGAITVNGGQFNASTTGYGAEGLESKDKLVINGGVIEVEAYDDGINAANSIVINGGYIYSYSSSNDGIDCNGTIKITGGVIVSSGSTAPEEGFDCDQNTFAITGGILVGTGGATSTPSSSASSQRSVIYKASGTADNILQIKSSSGDNLVYRLPRTYSSMTMLFSNPDLASGTQYTIVSGVTVSGGEEFHGLITGGTVSGGSSVKTFKPSSMVTTVQ